MRRNGLSSRSKKGTVNPGSRNRFWTLALATLILAGCGAEAYEQRLGNTKLLFAHMDLVNQNLQGTWSDPSTGVSLRAPLQFVLLPPPTKTEPPPDAAKKKAAGANEEMSKEEAEEGAEEVLDDRQPEFLNIELPGLRGAFRAPVKMIADKEGNAEGQAFLYVMTNHDLADKPEEAKEFSQEFIKALAEALGTTIDTEKDWRDEKFPPGDPATNGFVRPLKYVNVTITPGEQILGYTRQFSVYMYSQNDIQVIVMFVLPSDTDASENMTKRIPLCLETLAVAGERLALPTKGGAPAGTAPASAF